MSVREKEDLTRNQVVDKLICVLRGKKQRVTLTREEALLLLNGKLRNSNQEDTPGYGKGKTAPDGFWETKEAKKEARKRVDNFRKEKGVFPKANEVVVDLGLNIYFQLNRGDRGNPLGNVLKSLEYSKAEIKEAVERQTSPWRFMSREDVEKIGLGIRASNGFWSSGDAIIEGRRRIEGYIEEHHKLPDLEELRNLGLTGFVAVHKTDTHEGYLQVFRVVGYGEMLDEKLRSPERIAMYGHGVATPPRFWPSKDGIKEARRRFDEFKEEHGRLPDPIELGRLGLGGFRGATIAIAPTREDQLRLLGYNEEEIKIEMERKWNRKKRWYKPRRLVN